MVRTSDQGSADRLLGLSLRQLESVLATVVATASGEATPTSSNAITIKRRQMAELFCAKSVNTARCAVATSPRWMDFAAG